jgi:hypothetical protein
MNKLLWLPWTSTSKIWAGPGGKDGGTHHGVTGNALRIMLNPHWSTEAQGNWHFAAG